MEERLLTKHKTVREALRFVAAHPVVTTAPIDTPAWQAIAVELFEIANSPDNKVRGAMTRATRAQKMIADRLVGTRRPGTHPAEAKRQVIQFRDLTEGITRE